MKRFGWCLTAGLLAACLCTTLVHAKKHRRGETFGDLGDEIIADTPTQTNRKNIIPRGYPQQQQQQQQQQQNAFNHNIQARTINRDTINHYVNPLFYREFTSAPAYRRDYHASQAARLPARSVPSNTAREYIPPWSKNHAAIPPWSKKNIIHRPSPFNRLPGMPSNFRRPAPAMVRGKVPAAPRPKPAARAAAQKKWYPSKTVVAKTAKRAGAVKPRPRYLPKAPKRRVHVQIVPSRAQPIRNAKQMGIHSGFVLMPVRSSHKRQPPPPRTAATARRTKSVRGSPQSDRFAEKKHLFVPMTSHLMKMNSPQHFNAIRLPVTDVGLPSYHIDDIGNLIPDISNPKFFEPLPKKPRFNVLTKTACRIPMKRDGMCPIPGPKPLLPNPFKAKSLAAKATVATRNQRLLLNRQQQLARQMKLPPRAAVRKPMAARPKPKSSQRILYFAQKNNNKAAQLQQQQQQLQQQRYLQQRRKAAVSPPPARGRAPVAARGGIRPPAASRGPSMYEVPKISNKVYNYINQKTSGQQQGGAKGLAGRAMNPLLKYLQFHRTHPASKVPAVVAPRQPADPNQSRIDKRSIVTMDEE